MQENFEKDALFYEGAQEWQKNMNNAVLSQGLLSMIESMSFSFETCTACSKSYATSTRIQIDWNRIRITRNQSGFRTPSTRIQVTKNAFFKNDWIRVDEALRSIKESTQNRQSNPYGYRSTKR